MKKKKIVFAVLSFMLVAATILSFNILSPNKAEAADVATVVFHDFATVTTATSSKTSDTVSLNLNSSSISLWGKTVSPKYIIMEDTEDYDEDIKFIGWTPSETATDLPSVNTLNQTVTAASPLHLYAVYEYTIHCGFYFDSSYSNLLKKVTSSPIRVNSAVADIGDPWGVVLDMVNFNYGSPLPYRLGYTLASWQIGDVTYTPSETIVGDSNFDVYANWAECDTYTLAYNANGGSGAPSSQEENVGLAVTVSSTTPTRTGYTFAGWNTKADGTGTDYAAGSSYTSSTKGTYTLYAKWQINSSKLVVNPNGGTWNSSTSSSTITKNYGTTQSIPKPTRTGYTFAGWTKSSPFNGSITSTTADATYTFGANNNVTDTLTADWDVNQYTVTFKANGHGTAPSAQTVNYNNKATEPADPSATGYIFGGWYTETGCENKWNFNTSITTDLTLYAKWTPVSYKVVYNGNGNTSGSTSYSTHVFDVDKALTANGFVKTGYTFDGWNTKADGTGTGYSNQELVRNLTTINGATVNLYAQWDKIDCSYTVKTFFMKTSGFYDESNPDSVDIVDGDAGSTVSAVLNPSVDAAVYQLDNEHSILSGTVLENSSLVLKVYYSRKSYTLTFDANGGKYTNESVTKNASGLVGANVGNIEIPKRAGYTFVEWRDKAENGTKLNVPNTIPAENKTFYAYWTINSYSALFYKNDGTTETSPFNTFTADYGEDIVADKTPSRTGYTFVGWNTDKDATVKLNSLGTMPVSGKKFYAVWKINQYTITFDTKGGSTIAPITQNYNTTVNAPSDPTKTGYIFSGWDREIPSKMPADNITITASWTPISYTIKFVGGAGSTNTMSDMSMKFDESKNLTSNAFSKVGYIFAGWSGSDGKDYINKEEVCNLTSVNNDVITMTAKWSSLTYSIIYQTNGGKWSNGETSDKAISGDITTSTYVEDPVRTGYEFKGWDIDKDGIADEIPDTIPPVSGGTVAVAVWKAVPHTITFDTKGGSTINPITQDYNTDVAKPSNPTKYGYNFNGWDREVPAKMPNEDITITASWLAKDCEARFHANNGTDSVITEIVAFNNNITAPDASKNPVRSGYVFSGWAKTSTATEAISNLGIMDDENGKDFYAVWKVASVPYSVERYEMGIDGQYPSQPVKTYSSAANGSSVNYTPDHNAWQYVDNDKSQLNITVKADKENVIKAYIGRKQYTVTYDLKGGTSDGVTSGTPVSYYYGADVMPVSAKKTGYTFKGWSTDVPSVMPAENIITEAVWQINQYTIRFVDEDGETDLAQPIKQNYNTDITAPATPTKEGYVFDKWDKEIPAKMPAKDMVIKGSWNKEQYTYRFAVNDGSSVADITESYGRSLNGYSTYTYKEGYDFEGWYEDEGLTSKYTIPSTMPDLGENGTVKTLYAKWTAAKYKITYNPNGGIWSDDDNDNKPKSETKKYLEVIDFEEVPHREGFTFDGWDHMPEVMPARNTEVKAEWARETYSYKFVVNGGSDVAKITAAYDEDISDRSVVTKKTGYVFDGWYEDEGFVHKYNIPDKMPDLGEDGAVKTLYAKWKNLYYTITFDSKGGSEVADITAKYNEKVNQPNAPVKKGYDFAGWKLKDVSVEWPYTMEAHDVTMVADWAVKQYTITFDTDGGTPVAPITKDYGDEVSEPENPTKEGHTFRTWDKEIPETMPAKDQTITAIWDVNSYTIKFDTDGGTPVDDITAEFGSKVVAPVAPKKTGYTFIGWTRTVPESIAGLTYTDVDNDNIPDNMPAADVTLVANWNKNLYLITFNANGGQYKDETEVHSGLLAYETSIGKPEIPERTGYEFNGWDVFIPETMPAHNLTANALWKVKQYTITFDSKGGTPVDPITKDYGQKIVKPNDPTKEGYSFNGWSEPVPDTMPAENKILTADWVVNQYTIHFDTLGGTEIADITKDFGAKVDAPSAPEKTGYKFMGWKRVLPQSVDGLTIVDADKDNIPDTMAATDMTLQAIWNALSYTVTFDANGGNFPDGKLKVSDERVCGDELIVPQAPRKTGYTFVGWDINEDGTADTLPGTVPAHDITAKAVWKINQYTITFDTKGGTEIAPITQNYNTKVVAPENPIKTGYKFLGWDMDIPSVMPAENLVITAKWKVNAHTITFDTKGGTPVAPITQNYGTKISTPDDPTKEGYTFVGWDKEIPEIMPDDDMTITAKWTINQYNANFYYNDGTNKKFDSIKADYNSDIVFEKEPVRTGYKFLGWNTDKTAAEPLKSLGKMPSDNINFYAVWKINRHTISFDTNGGSTIEPITQDYGTDVTAPENPVKEGYTFNGWDKKIPETMPDEDVEITADWKINQYTITFDTKGGTPIAPITQDYNTSVVSPADPEKEGHKFLGWDKEIPSVMPAENMTITAEWKANIHKVVFDTDGGSEIEPIIQAYGTEITEPENPTKEGYTFVGWDKDIPSVMPDYDTEVKAKWKANDYTIFFDGNGGEGAMEPIKAVYNEDVDLPDNLFTRDSEEHYRFLGWNTEKDGTGRHFDNKAHIEKANLTSEPKGKVTLYAQWALFKKTSEVEAVKPGAVIKYSIKLASPEAFDGLEITDILPECVTYNNDAVITLNGKSVTFGQTIEANKIKFDINTEDVEKDHIDVEIKLSVTVSDCVEGTKISNTATASFNNSDITSNTDERIVEYFTVKYDANGATSGSAPVDNTFYDNNAEATVAESGNLVKEDSRFAGWNTKADGTGKHYNPGETLTLTKDVVLYAQWMVGIKEVKADREDVVPGSTLSYTIKVAASEANQTLTVTDAIPKNTTYKTGSAKIDSEDADVKYDAENKVITWSFNTELNKTYTVTFDVTVDESALPLSIISNKAQAEINGNTFTIGSSSDGKTPCDVQVSDYHTVAYSGRGADDETKAPVDNRYYQTDDEVTVLNNGDLTKKDSSFAGWYIEDEDSNMFFAPGDKYIIRDKDVVFVPAWFSGVKTAERANETLKPGDVINYTIKVKYSEDGEKLVITDKIPEGTHFSAEANTISGNGQFEEAENRIVWVIDSADSAEEYTFGFSVTLNADADSKQVITNQAKAVIGNDYNIFYIGSDPNDNSEDAKCDITSDEYFTVKYNIGDAEGTTPVDNSHYLAEDVIVIADDKDFDKEGYIFAGWNTDKNGDGKHYDADAETAAENLVLYAQWVKFNKTSVVVGGECKPGASINYSISLEIPEVKDTVIIEDIVSEALIIKEGSLADNAVIEGNKITWTFENNNSKQFTVSFVAEVSGNVKNGDVISNRAKAIIGEDSYDSTVAEDKVGYFTITYITAEGEKGSAPVDNTFYSNDDNAVVAENKTLKKDGFDFVGWADTDNNTYAENETVKMNKDIVLHALWSKVVKTSSIEEKVLKAGDVITYSISVTIPEGFDEVTVTDNVTETLKISEVSESDNIKCKVKDNTAVWTIKKSGNDSEYKLTMKAVVLDTVKPGTEISNNASAEFDNGYVITSNVDKKNVGYEITYVDGEEIYTDGKQYNAGDKAQAISPLHNTVGSYFDTWNTKADGSGDSYKANENITVSGNMTLYSMRIKNIKSVEQVTNGGKPGSTVIYSIKVSTPYDGKDIVIRDNLPAALEIIDVMNADSLENCIISIFNDEYLEVTFEKAEANKEYEVIFNAKINDNANANDVIANISVVETNGSKVESEAAQFTVGNLYSVTYNANGAEGSVPVDGNSYTNGEKFEVMGGSGLIMNGYKFKGWCDSPDGNGTYYDEGDLAVANNDVTLYAIFERIPEKVVVPDTGSDMTLTYFFILALIGGAFTLVVADRKKRKITE